MSDVAITVASASVEQGAVSRLAGTLEAMGAEVVAVHETIGVVSARASSDALDRIRALPEVESVEVGREFELPPPDSDVQ